MKNYPIWKSFTVIILVVLGIIFSIPSIIYDDNSESWFLKDKINLGLDLQGGSYLLLEVESDVLYNEELENFSDTIRLIAREKKVKINNLDIKNDEIIFRFNSSNQLDKIKNEFIKNYSEAVNGGLAMVQLGVNPLKMEKSIV